MFEKCLNCKTYHVRLWDSGPSERMYCMECGMVFERKGEGDWKIAQIQKIKEKTGKKRK